MLSAQDTDLFREGTHGRLYERLGCALGLGAGGDNSVLSFRVLAVCSFARVLRRKYIVRVPSAGCWRECLNSDAQIYAGRDGGNFGGVKAALVSAPARPDTVSLTLPPLAIIVLRSAAAIGAGVR